MPRPRRKIVRMTEEQRLLAEANRGLAYKMVFTLWERFPRLKYHFDNRDDAIGSAYLAICRAAIKFKPGARIQILLLRLRRSDSARTN